jgi:hypothetical protein
MGAGTDRVESRRTSRRRTRRRRAGRAPCRCASAAPPRRRGRSCSATRPGQAKAGPGGQGGSWATRQDRGRRRGREEVRPVRLDEPVERAVVHKVHGLKEERERVVRRRVRDLDPTLRTRQDLVPPAMRQRHSHARSRPPPTRSLAARAGRPRSRRRCPTRPSPRCRAAARCASRSARASGSRRARAMARTCPARTGCAGRGRRGSSR